MNREKEKTILLFTKCRTISLTHESVPFYFLFLNNGEDNKVQNKKEKDNIAYYTNRENVMTPFYSRQKFAFQSCDLKLFKTYFC